MNFTQCRQEAQALTNIPLYGTILAIRHEFRGRIIAEGRHGGWLQYSDDLQ